MLKVLSDPHAEEYEDENSGGDVCGQHLYRHDGAPSSSIRVARQDGCARPRPGRDQTAALIRLLLG